MADRKIDYDRGVIIKIAKDTGMDVFMYKDTPGVYLSAYGTPVSEELARMAGYDVEKLSKARERQLRLSLFKQNLDMELEAVERAERKVFREKDGWKIIELPEGRFVIEDPDGQSISQGTVLTERMAVSLFDGLTEGPKSRVDVAPSPGPSGGSGDAPRGGARRSKVAPS